MAARRVERLMARLYLVRHGRATGGWDVDPDPGLDELGRQQADGLVERLAPLGPLPVVTSPLRRCQQTAAPLAAHWEVEVVIEPLVAEIPSPPGVPMDERVAWLRQAMAGTWTALGGPWTDYRDEVLAYMRSREVDTVVVSHFVAINAVIGACRGDDRLVVNSLDNASVTIVETSASGLVLLETGHEADTLIR
jgi:broad specificity phosphatase PhoE